jgi:hypothetical protein
MTKKKTTKKKAGRPKKLTIDDALLDRVKALAARGLNRKQISQSLGISETLRCALMNNEPRFKTALEEGESLGIAQVTSYLMNSARGGNVTAQIFYLKNRDPDNWKDRRHIDETHRFSREDIDIDENMTPKQAAQQYADTLRRGTGEVIPIGRAKR